MLDTIINRNGFLLLSLENYEWISFPCFAGGVYRILLTPKLVLWSWKVKTVNLSEMYSVALYIFITTQRAIWKLMPFSGAEKSQALLVLRTFSANRFRFRARVTQKKKPTNSKLAVDSVVIHFRWSLWTVCIHSFLGLSNRLYNRMVNMNLSS